MRRTLDMLAEHRIREAQLRGVLDDLAQAGKPLRLGDLVGLGRDERVEALLLRSVGSVPEEVTMLRELAALTNRLAADPPPRDADHLKGLLRDKAVRLSAMFRRSGRNLSAHRIEEEFLTTAAAERGGAVGRAGTGR